MKPTMGLKKFEGIEFLAMRRNPLLDWAESLGAKVEIVPESVLHNFLKQKAQAEPPHVDLSHIVVHRKVSTGEWQILYVKEKGED